MLYRAGKSTESLGLLLTYSSGNTVPVAHTYSVVGNVTIAGEWARAPLIFLPWAMTNRAVY